MPEALVRLTAPPTPAQLEEARAKGTPAHMVVGRLNPAQLAYIHLDTEIQVFLGGFGGGKTFIGAWKSTCHLRDNPGCTGLAIAPTYALAKNQYRAVMLLLERIKALYGVNLVESSKISAGQGEIVLTNGSTLLFRSAASRVGIYGLSVAFIWLDELELCENPEQIYGEVMSRLRQQSDGTSVTVNSHNVYISSTAHSLSGILADLIARARREHGEYEAAIEAGVKNPKPPSTGIVRAPSTRAIGYGLDKPRIETWLREMDSDEFLRGVMCQLLPPQEVIFADRVVAEDYPCGNVVDYQFNPTNKTYLLVDWGNRRPHVLLTQKVEEWDALVVLEEWGPEGSSVADTVQEMRNMLFRHGLVNSQGRPLGAKRFAIIGDPTSNPGATYKGSDENMLAIEGRATCNALGWAYTAPERPEQRSKRRQIQFGRALLKPKLAKPRVLFARPLTVAKDVVNRSKRTRRGIWHALNSGYCYEKTAQNIVTDTPKKDRVWDHAPDALLYGLVIIFDRDFWNLYSVESGRYTGSAGW